MSVKHLKRDSLKPTKVSGCDPKDCWYYEDGSGLDIIINEQDEGGKVYHVRLSWCKIKASLMRKEQATP